MNHHRRAALALTAFFCVPVFGADLTVHIDAREVARRYIQTHESLAVKPGPLVLVYPKWIPAEHSPSGPLDSIIGLEITANGQRLAWHRDPYEMFALSVTVPSGVNHLEITLESGLSTGGDSQATAADAAARVAIIKWNEFVLLPKGRDAATIAASGSLQIPAGWNSACALDSHAVEGGALEFEPVSLAQLIDSPVQLGQFVRRVDLAGSAPHPDMHHLISIAADSAAATEVPADFAQRYGRLVAEAGALFGSRHYRHYTWLLSLSDHLPHFGEEHHESSDDRAPESILKEEGDRELLAGLLGHEYVHSWNGKFRRPQGLLSPDYLKPMDGSLLWVYEGMTQFWGDVLPARAGLIKPEDYRDIVAESAGHFDVSTGPRWRPLADTAVEAQVLYDSPTAWVSARRSVDYYQASVFLWLDVDSQLRTRSGGKATIDDFVRRFYSGNSDGQPEVKPYAERDLYTALSAIAPADWHDIVHKHLDEPDPAALFEALKHAGWQLSYSSEKNTYATQMEKLRKATNREWSIGLRLNEKGTITDAIGKRAAALAGASPGMTVIAVNGRKYAPDVLDAAITAAQSSHKPIELLVENDDYYSTLSVAYFDGPRYPHLVRVEGVPDTLTEVLKPRAH
jgi:predicted metalloprotease with PDZ domain